MLDVPEEVCGRAQRLPARPATSARHVIRRQRSDLRRSLSKISARRVPRASTSCAASDIEDAVIGYERAWTDKTDLTGPFDIIGDVHGCASELATLLAELGYDADGVHPENRTAVFVGDLVDRGPDTPGGAAPGHGHGRAAAPRCACRATTSRSWCGR